MKDEIKHFLPNGEQINPPEPYKTVYQRVLTSDNWHFQNFPCCPVFLRRYVQGEFWPIIGFIERADEDIWVSVIRVNDHTRSRVPMGVAHGILDGAQPPSQN